MANNGENNISDEDYLDSLLNSVVSNDDGQKLDNDEQMNIEGDFDVISEDDLFDFGDISFDDLLEESLQDELDSLDIKEDAASLALNNIDESSDEEPIIDDSILSGLADEEPVIEDNVSEADTTEAGLEQDDMQALFNMLNSDFDSTEENNVSDTEPTEEVSTEANNEMDSIFGMEDTEDTDASADMDELSKMLNDLSSLANDANDTNDDDVTEATIEEINEEEPKEKKGLFSKIFGKKEKKDKGTDKSESEDSQMVSFDDFDLDGIEDRTEANEREQAKKEKAEAKAKKAQEKKEKREQAKAERAEKAKKKKAEKEKRVKPPVEVIDIPAPVYLLVITFVAGIGLIVYFGSNSLSYNSDMNSAVKAYTKDDYSGAYDYLSGMDIKNKDKNFYDQVVTIMYVEKQYLSYNNYRKIEDYNRALDSLLKGIEKYDKHKATAQELNVLDDFKVSYNRILKALKYDFKLSEEKAREIADILNEKEYSERVREVVENNLITIESNITKENEEKAAK